MLFLTARGDEFDKVVGLELGADDYVTKPFALRELMSRIRALLRRAYGDLANAAGGRVIRHGDLVIDLERRRVQRGTRRIGLTATEFEILRHLASRPGRVFSRRELLELLRDYEALDQDEKTINVHVSHLRDKIEDDPVAAAVRAHRPRRRLPVRRALTWPTPQGRTRRPPRLARASGHQAFDSGWAPRAKDGRQIRPTVPQSFQTRLTFAFMGVVALTLALVAPIVINRLDDYFRQHEEQSLHGPRQRDGRGSSTSSCATTVPGDQVVVRELPDGHGRPQPGRRATSSTATCSSSPARQRRPGRHRRSTFGLVGARHRRRR